MIEQVVGYIIAPILKFKLEILPYESHDVFSDCFEYDQDSYGHDIHKGAVTNAQKGVASAAACQELCNKNADCNYFTYGSTIHSGHCWLKSKKAKTLTAKTGLISGPKTCVGELGDTTIISTKFRFICILFYVSYYFI